MAVRQGLLNNLYRCRYLGCCCAFHRKVLDLALPFPAKHTYSPHDYWLALIAELKFKVQLIHQPLIIYRRHEKNTSSGGKKSKNTLWVKILIRLYIFMKLVNRVFFRRKIIRVSE